MNNSYKDVMVRRNEIMRLALGLDYDESNVSSVTFGYEAMTAVAGYSLDDVAEIQWSIKVGRAPPHELHRLIRAVRAVADPDEGTRVPVKDEAVNTSGSFEARRASLSAHETRKEDFKGVVIVTNGSYGAAAASQAARQGLKYIMIQEVYDSEHVGQLEIVEKPRVCEAYGAGVVKLTVGPEPFYVLLRTLEETGHFNVGLYIPYRITGVGTFDAKIGCGAQERYRRQLDTVAVTYTGSGDPTGTAHGLRKVGCDQTQVVAAPVDLVGLYMASDKNFSNKSFTTGYIGFRVSFATWPDRMDVLRNAARAPRYMNGYHLATRGEVFYTIELLTELEGLERDPAGNTGLTVTVTLVIQTDRDQIVVAQETEYIDAGKHHNNQLSFAESQGIEVRRGSSAGNAPGKAIAIPERLNQVAGKPLDFERLHDSYTRRAAKVLLPKRWSSEGVEFLAVDANTTEEHVRSLVPGVAGGG